MTCSSKKQNFNGYFTQHYQHELVPGSLLSFTYMLTGSSYNPASNEASLSAHIQALSIAQLIQFNTVAEQRTSRQFRHNIDKKTHLSIYFGFLLHSHTRSGLLIDKFYDLGLCISYQRMLPLSTSLVNSMCDLFEEEGFACPPLLRSNVFTTYVVDNIDHNPCFRRASNSWHDTAISATQHLEHANDGVQRSPIQLSQTKANSLRQLPVTYTTIKAYMLKSEDVLVAK